MKYLELAPSPALRPYARLLWCLELETPVEFGPPERIAPDGIVELVFHYRVPMAIRFAQEPFALQARSSVVTQTRRFLEIQPGGPTGLISVRFNPWGAYHFFEPPVSELADQVISAEDLWGGVVRELEDRLAEAGSLRERVTLVERFLLGQLEQHQKPNVESLVRGVWKRKGHVKVAALCQEFGLGERTLQRTFRNAIGMPPKGFARLTRFLHACAVLRQPRQTSLTQVAYDCSYYDQAHFIDDFKDLSGVTPGQFLSSGNISFLAID